MDIRLQLDTENINWQAVIDLLSKESMAVYSMAKHKAAFENSTKVIFVYDGESFIGCGRLLTDGSYQGVLYDIVVDSKYQGKGIGAIIIQELLDGQEDKNIMLYATPGKEGFYEKFNFRKVKTAMCRFINLENAISKGFID